jgi:hypothetical protein
MRKCLSLKKFFIVSTKDDSGTKDGRDCRPGDGKLEKNAAHG